jgi:hypothetical protein
MKLVFSIALFAYCALFASRGQACSVPVFRYALEHWAADAYQVEIAHHGPLAGPEQALVQRLTGSKLSNISVKLVETADTPPHIVVKHPASLSQPREVWSVPLTTANVEALLDSPMRQEIATKLGDGDSAVWVLLESGDKAADDTAATVLERQLTRLAETMELPKLDAQDIKNGLVSVPDEGLRLSFPLLRLQRSNPAEQFLVHTLLATEQDLHKVTAPIAFPIFGRGRVLYALVGKGILADNLGEAANFLIGSCSCQIKEQNPGVDLLMSADWQKLLKTEALLDEDLPKLSDVEGLKPILIPIPDRPARATEQASQTSNLPLSTLLGLSIGMFLISWRRMRSKRQDNAKPPASLDH